jgi:uncharacterized membrane protein YfcA
MPTEYYFIAAAGSLLAGIINTLAGNGSSITLSILMYVIGLPPQQANATIRVGIFAMSMGALPTFLKKGHIKIQRDWLLVTSMTIGAIFGIFTAVLVSNEVFKEIFKYMFIIMLGLALFDTKSWLRKTGERVALSPPLVIILFLLVGFYGGFVQMGVGVFFLFVTVLGARYNLIDASGLKLACVALYTPIAILVFAWHGLICWDLALAMSIGELIGGRLGAHFATTHPKAAFWAHRLLVVVLIAAIIRAFWP